MPVAAFQAGDTRPPRWDMISAESSESRPSRYAVASRALTPRPRPRAGSYEEDGGGAGYDVQAGRWVLAPVRRAINVQLARVTRGQPRPLQAARIGRSAARSGVAAPFPKLIVRVRFSSPAPPVPAQVRAGMRSLRLACSHTVFDLPGH